MSAKAALVTPASLTVDVEASCAPWSSGQAVIDVIVEQPIPATTNANEGEGVLALPCDGVKHRVTVTVTGGPFHAGLADAFGGVVAGPLPAMTATRPRSRRSSPAPRRPRWPPMRGRS